MPKIKPSSSKYKSIRKQYKNESNLKNRNIQCVVTDCPNARDSLLFRFPKDPEMYVGS